MTEKYTTEETVFMAATLEMQCRAHETAVGNGFYDDDMDTSFAGKLMLVVTELSEALEAWRENLRYTVTENGKPEGFESEFADAVIRILDMAEYHKIPLGYRIVEKARYNQSREYRHGGKLA